MKMHPAAMAVFEGCSLSVVAKAMDIVSQATRSIDAMPVHERPEIAMASARFMALLLILCEAEDGDGDYERAAERFQSTVNSAVTAMAANRDAFKDE